MCFIFAVLAKIYLIYAVAKWFLSKNQRNHLKSGQVNKKEVAKSVRETLLIAAEWVKTIEHNEEAKHLITSTISTSKTESPFKNPSTSILITDYSLYETLEAFTITVDLPGFRREDIQLTVIDTDREILIRGASKGAKPRKLDVKVALPRTCDLSKVSAVIAIGVLTIEVSKTEFEGRKVNVEMKGFEDGWEPGV
ncbi:hypothetical protein BC829DRAFT_386006 [Chytridium lagenaria]|nr:hypothetical protein BC829DRAFT_386006 [Chytridium lagenaria]